MSLTSNSLSTAGDVEDLVRSHLDMARRMASHYCRQRPKADFDAIWSAACLGLTQAAMMYDPTRGRFSVYAAAKINGAILDEARLADPLDRGQRRRIKQMHMAHNELLQEFGREPTPAELTARTRLSEMALKELSRAQVLSDTVSLDSHAAQENKATVRAAQSIFADEISQAYENDCDEDTAKLLWTAVQALPDRLRHVCMRYYFDEASLITIAEELDITPSRASQMRYEISQLLRLALSNIVEGAPRVCDEPRDLPSRYQAYCERVARDTADCDITTICEYQARLRARGAAGTAQIRQFNRTIRAV